jgi:hypothetical protein
MRGKFEPTVEQQVLLDEKKAELRAERPLEDWKTTFRALAARQKALYQELRDNRFGLGQAKIALDWAKLHLTPTEFQSIFGDNGEISYDELSEIV